MVNTNPLYTTAEMAHQFTDSGAVGLIVIDLFAPKVAEVLPKTSIKTVVVVTISDLLPTVKRLLVYGVQKYVKKMIPPITFTHTTFARALAAGADRMATGADPKVYAHALDLNSVAALQYTGGTTGVAKGATLTHGNLVANIVPGPRDVEAVPALRAGSDADRAAAVPHLRVHREPDDLLPRRRTQHPHPEPAADVEHEDGDAHRTHHLVYRRQHDVCRADARAVVPGEIGPAGRYAARWPAAWRWCR